MDKKAFVCRLHHRAPPLPAAAPPSPSLAGSSLDGGLFTLGLFLPGVLLLPLWLSHGMERVEALSSVGQRRVRAGGIVAIFLLGCSIGQGGGIGSYAWGVITGALVSIVGIISWHAYGARAGGTPMPTIGAMLSSPLSKPPQSRTNPLAAADTMGAATATFTPPICSATVATTAPLAVSSLMDSPAVVPAAVVPAPDP